MTDILQRKLANLPTKPGVYLHKDAKGKVLYVGKAKNLRNRVRSYFQPGAKHEPKTEIMVRKVVDFDTIVTRTEVEALLIESNFIKQYRPPYNVVLRDDKHYLFLKIDLREPWPRPLTVRQTGEKGVRYFGPYTNAGKVRASLKVLRKVFPWCDMAHKLKQPVTNKRPCFNYRLGLCAGACIGKVAPEDYREIIEGFVRYLDGDTGDIDKRLQREMQEASANEEFERAAQLRDRLDALASLRQVQQAIDVRGRNRDVIGLARDEGHAVVVLLTIRDGRMVARQEFTFWGEGQASDEEVLDSFLAQYYKVASNLPDEVLVPMETPNAGLVCQLLIKERGKKVPVSAGQRGERRRLLQLAKENAEDYLRHLRSEWLADKERTNEALGDLIRELALPKPPARIECYDISNLTGNSTVGSMVVFQDGKPAKAHYRRFRIKHVVGIDDFASVREVLRRRFAKVAAQTTGEDASFESLPDLVIIDGGKGQVSAATAALEELSLLDLPLIGLAKRFEEVIVRPPDGEFQVLTLPPDSQGLYLLQRIRDEAHRFAISYNRNLRSKAGIRSALDEIPGIGPVKKKQLMKEFGSVRAIREADLVKIQSVVGQAAGRVVKENL